MELRIYIVLGGLSIDGQLGHGKGSTTFESFKGSGSSELDLEQGSQVAEQEKRIGGKSKSQTGNRQETGAVDHCCWIPRVVKDLLSQRIKQVIHSHNSCDLVSETKKEWRIH